MQRIFEITLLVVIVVGGVVLWRTTVQRDELQREHDRLSAKIGVLVIKDPAQVHLRAIDTGDPMHFAWRAYFPANYRWSYTSKSGSGGSSSSSPMETILRVRLREIDPFPLVTIATRATFCITNWPKTVRRGAGRLSPPRMRCC